jgi:hypothetical protein
MGAVDLVIQVESPKSVARGLQRIGRAGHGVGDVSRGRIFPKFRADLLECAVVAGACARARSRRPSCRATRSTCSPSRSSRSPREPPETPAVSSTSCTRSSPHLLLRRALPRAARERARHARRPLPVQASSASCARGSSGTGSPARSARARRAPARGHQRRHDPRPRPVRGHAARRPPRRRARRGDGLRGRARARRSCSAPRPGGSRRSAATA